MTVVPYIIDFLDFKVASLTKLSKNFPANVYLFKVNNIKTRKRCAICSKLTIKIQERRRPGYHVKNRIHSYTTSAQ